MKMKYASITLMFLLIFCLTSCSGEKSKGVVEMTGTISLTDDVLNVNEYEIVWGDNVERIKELKLTDDNLVSGYFINDTSDEVKPYKITKDTEFTVYDTDRLFVDEDAEDVIYKTQNLKEFSKFLYFNHMTDEIGDTPYGGPFEIIVSGDEVVSVTEIFVV